MIIKKINNYGLRISILLFTLLHIITAFNEQLLLIHLLSFMGLAIILFVILSIPISKLKLPLFILLISFIILIFSGSDIITGFFFGVREMRNIIGLLVVIPLISWVLQEESYIEDLVGVFHEFINTSKKFYFTLMSLTQVFAYFLLFGSIPMMYQFIDIILKDQKSEFWERYKGTALLRGFSFSTLWVITMPSFIVVVDTLGASIYISIAQGFGISLIGMFIAVLFVSSQERKKEINITPILQENINNVLLNASVDMKVRKHKAIEFFFLFLTLFGTIFLIHGIWKVPLMILIPLVIIGWIIAFYIYKQRSYKLKIIAKEYVTNGLKQQAGQLTIMLSIGILIYALNQTNFAVNVVDGINYIEGLVSWLNPLYLLPFIVIILGLLGLGPLTVMVLVAGILNSLALPYPPELIVLAITSGSVISVLISPMIMPLIILSTTNGLSLFTNGIKFNWKYSVVFYIVTQIYIQLMILVW